jgi:hypothetical protein
MSSATSISPAARSRDEGFRPSHFFLLASLVAATVAVVIARQTTPEHLVLISLAIGAAGVAGAALYRTLAPLVGEGVSAYTAPLTDRNRAALEREKTLTLRSIKELEFDRSMGKVSETDFAEMSGRLRARALSLMQQLDATPEGGPGHRDAIERELASRLNAARVPAPAPVCPSCATTNDADAAFCKRCGQRLRPERGAKPPSESEREPSTSAGGGAPVQVGKVGPREQ